MSDEEFVQLYGWLGLEFRRALHRFLDAYLRSLSMENRFAFLVGMRNEPLAVIYSLFDAVNAGSFTGQVFRLGKEAVEALSRYEEAMEQRGAKVSLVIDWVVYKATEDWLSKTEAKAELSMVR